MYGNTGTSRGPTTSTNNMSSINTNNSSTVRKPAGTLGGATTTTTTSSSNSKFVISSRPTGNVSVNPSLTRTTPTSASSVSSTGTSWSLPTPTTGGVSPANGGFSATNSYLNSNSNNNNGLSRTGTTVTNTASSSSYGTGTSTSAASSYINSNRPSSTSASTSSMTTSLKPATVTHHNTTSHPSSSSSSSSTLRPGHIPTSSSSSSSLGTNRPAKLPSSSSVTSHHSTASSSLPSSTTNTNKRPSSQGSTVSSSRSSVTESSLTGGKSNTGTSSSSATASSTNHKLVKKELLKFTLKDLIMSTTVGTGTFGRVRVVQYKPTRTWYALKILKKSEIIRLRQVEHIQSEVKILSQVSHPFIVNMLGFLTDEKRLYMLFDYVPGGELFSHLRRMVKFTNDAARFYAAEIVLAFEYLHNFNIVYRDLKPENLLLTSKGHVKITDFGFAKVVDDRTYTLCGTPEYLAPEIIQSKGHNKGADWWAIGILIYEMLAGYPPFLDETPYGIYQKILDGKIEWPPHFTTEAKDLIKKLLTAERTRRLGCLFSGAKDIKEHPWFGKLNWEQVYNCAYPAPLVPPVKDANDTSNFDDYPDSDGDTAGRLSGKEAAEFAELDKF